MLAGKCISSEPQLDRCRKRNPRLAFAQVECRDDDVLAARERRGPGEGRAAATREQVASTAAVAGAADAVRVGEGEQQGERSLRVDLSFSVASPLRAIRSRPQPVDRLADALQRTAIDLDARGGRRPVQHVDAQPHVRVAHAGRGAQRITL